MDARPLERESFTSPTIAMQFLPSSMQFIQSVKENFNVACGVRDSKATGLYIIESVTKSLGRISRRTDQCHLPL